VTGFPGKSTSGFVTQLMSEMATTIGKSERALHYQILLNEEYPSWGFEIKNGATTIWERWVSYVKNDPGKMASLNNGMNSFSHCAFWQRSDLYTINGNLFNPNHAIEILLHNLG